MSDDPSRRFKRWLAQARRAGQPLPEACALATADGRGRPSVRYMLLKGADEAGWVFYTSLGSRKARELAANPHAALAFYWDVTGHQVRVEGRVTAVDPAEADAYWASRPRESRIAACASRQSTVVESRAQLNRKFREIERRFVGGDIPRPSGWSGYRLRARRVEFWTRNEPRFHYRELFVHGHGGWQKKLLQP